MIFDKTDLEEAINTLESDNGKAVGGLQPAILQGDEGEPWAANTKIIGDLVLSKKDTNKSTVVTLYNDNEEDDDNVVQRIYLTADDKQNQIAVPGVYFSHFTVTNGRVQLNGYIVGLQDSSS